VRILRKFTEVVWSITSPGAAFNAFDEVDRAATLKNELERQLQRVRSPSMPEAA
jgi:hypothetical protein